MFPRQILRVGNAVNPVVVVAVQLRCHRPRNLVVQSIKKKKNNEPGAVNIPFNIMIKPPFSLLRNDWLRLFSLPFFFCPFLLFDDRLYRVGPDAIFHGHIPLIALVRKKQQRTVISCVIRDYTLQMSADAQNDPAVL